MVEGITVGSTAGTVTFETGAVRSSDRVGERYDLISPIGLRRLAKTCHEGATKYSDFNWERGMPVSEMLNHAISHIYSYASGDRSEDHLAHAAWNMFGAMHSEEMWPHLNGNMRGPGCVPPVVGGSCLSSSVRRDLISEAQRIIDAAPRADLLTDGDPRLNFSGR